MINQKTSKITPKILISATALLLASCQDQGPTTSSLAPHEQADLTLAQMIKADHKTSEDKDIAKGMQAIIDGDLHLASRTFNKLLIDDPLNAKVHTLNGLTYQLMAQNGEVAKMSLAQAGFEQALKIEPHNTIAALQLGRIAIHKKDFVKAQEYFSDALLMDSRNMDAQFELASASYRMGDLKTAAMSIDRVLVAHPNEARNVRAAALIYAALGKQDQAHVYLSKYSTLPINKRHKKHLERRVEDWADLHSSGRLVAHAAGDSPAAIGAATGAATAHITEEATAAASKAATAVAKKAAADATASAIKDVTTAATTAAIAAASKGVTAAATTAVTAAIAAEKAAIAAAAAAPLEEEKPKQEIYQDKQEDMIVVDAVIMRVSEEGTTSKGNNIMDNLTLSLAPFTYLKGRNAGSAVTGGSVFPTNNISTSQNISGLPVSTSIAGSVEVGEALKGSATTLITQGLSLGTINYSLNIANSGDKYAEIIGRPSLTATIGKAAKFFSGRNRHIAVAGQFGGNITDTPIGTTLNVTPTAYKDGFITLDIELIGSSLSKTITNINGAFDINKDNVKTTVRVKAGESVMLAGITQRELNTQKTGFPVLQNIPFIQYFFSKETTSSERKSVMYILTPRSYHNTITDTKRFFARGEEFGKRPKLTELERRHKDWYDPSINNTLILQHLGPVYGEFRTGDLHQIKWTHTDLVTRQLASIASFLWY